MEQLTTNTPLLTPIEGGFFVGTLTHNGQPHAVIISPKTEGEFTEQTWPAQNSEIPATSYTDGLANTRAMAEAGSEIAKQILALNINGFTGWAIPARDQLELIYRAAKPSTSPNWCSFRDGENPSALPPTYPYTEESPAQTEHSAFQAGNQEALTEGWYWSSTQYSRSSAWMQDFGTGGQDCNRKYNQARARAVRMIPLAI